MEHFLIKLSSAPRGGVTRQCVVLADLQSLLDCQSNISLSPLILKGQRITGSPLVRKSAPGALCDMARTLVMARSWHGHGTVMAQSYGTVMAFNTKHLLDSWCPHILGPASSGKRDLL